MSKLYGPDAHCQACNQAPALGFVYVCEQDAMVGEFSDAVKARKKLSKGKRRTLVELELLGFSESIIKAAEAGHYTAAQLDTLKTQKMHVRSTIEAAKETNKHIDALSKSGDENRLPYGDTIKPKPKHKYSFSNNSKPCGYKVCHKCRPFYRERCFVSFEAAFADEVHPPTFWQGGFMPVLNTLTIQELGLRAPVDVSYSGSAMGKVYGGTPASSLSATASSNSRQGLSDIEEEGIDAESAAHGLGDGDDTHPKKQSESMGFRDSLKRSLQDMLQRNKTGSSPHYFARKQKKLSTGLKEKDSLDMELWRRMSDDVLREAAARKLPAGDDSDLTDMGDVSLVDEEGHVLNGVAVTEEAVQTGVPDIITAV